MKNKTKLDIVIVLFQVLASLILAYLLIRLNVLPTYMLVLAFIVLAVLLLVIGLPLLRIKKRTFPKLVLRGLSIVLSVAILVTSFQYVARGTGFLQRITGGNYETNVVNAYVLVDSDLESINDAKESLFAFKRTEGQAQLFLDEAVADINKRLNTELNVTDYTRYDTLLDDFYAGNVDVILLNETEMPLVEFYRENFVNEVRVIHTYERRVEIENPTSNLDVTKDTFTIYISGIDTYGPVSAKSRSDVNLLMTVNPRTHEILLTSIPRDYYVELASFGAMDKLTHAGIYGVMESVNTLENLLDINIDFYARVNFTSVVEIVDALGGVDVYSHYTFTTFNGYQITAGYNFMDGTKALSFVRERYSLPGGDNARVVHQQELVKGIIDRITSPAILTNYAAILESLEDSIQLSMSSQDLSSLIRMQLEQGGSWDIDQFALKGFADYSTTTHSMPGYNLWVMIPDMNTVNEASARINAMTE